VAGTGILVVLALRADLDVPDASGGLVALDLAVGLAFIVAGWIASGPRVERWLVMGVGIAWLIGSIAPSTGAVHQAVLAVALVTFPSGRLRGSVSLLAFIAAAVVVAFGVVPQLGVAFLFAVLAGSAFVTGRSQRAGSMYAAIAAAAVSAAIALSWWSHRFDLGALDPTLALVVYESVFLSVAVAFPSAMRAVARARGRLADEVVADLGLGGLDGLAVALRVALGDAALHVYRWDGVRSSYVDDGGRPAEPGRDDRRWLTVDGLDGPIAAVAHQSGKLDDAPTAAAVESAIRLAVTNLRLRDELHERVVELEASRARILAAADRIRQGVASELRDEVEMSLELARSEVGSITVQDRDAEAALEIVVQELDATHRVLADLIMGVPPADLGDGRLGNALAELVKRCPIPVTVAVADGARGTPATEAVLYYVVSEALANALKHADATGISIDVRRERGELVASVADDGLGGADPSGSGLQGLADRVASARGRLRVESPPGAGTTVVATIPV
jgi:signal transduction histidine kinase